MRVLKHHISHLKILIVFAVMFLWFSAAFAQQTPNYSQYSQNRFLINPGATGAQKNFTALLGYRKQWVGYGNEPTTIYAGAHMGFQREKAAEYHPLAIRISEVDDFNFTQKDAELSKFTHGVGAYMVSDEFGAFVKNVFNLSYALHMEASKKLNISVGAKSGFSNMKFDQSKAIPIDQANDIDYLEFISDLESASMLDLDIGTYIHNDNFYVGYSTNQLLGDKISFGNSTANILELHHSILGGYTLKVGEDMQFTPSTYMKFVKGAPLSFDIGVRADYQEKFFGGVYYRNNDAIAIMLGAFFKDMYMFSYSYDINTSVVNNYSNGGHEVVLGFKLKNK